MFKKLFFAAVAAVGLIGCSEKEVELGNEQAGEKVQLTVSLPQGVTKVTEVANDAQVNTIQIFVFDKNGIYETSSKGTGSTLALTCTTGEKNIVALVNAPEEGPVDNIAQLRAKTAALSVCSTSNIIMSGEVKKTLTASTTITMQVERLAAKVAVAHIGTDFDLEAHKNLSFEIKSIYLINVAGDRAYLDDNTPSVWYNKAKYALGTSLPFLHDDVSDGLLADGESYDKEHFFYCFPNTSSTPTRLVVEAEIGGYIYYYPITLETVVPNTYYTYRLTITRLGSDSPDVPVAEESVNFTVTVKDWVETEVSEVI